MTRWDGVPVPDDRHARELLAAVAERTLSFDLSVWQWGDALTVDGMLEAGELLDDSRFTARMLGFYQRWAIRPLGWVDHLTPGTGALRLARGADRADGGTEAPPDSEALVAAVLRLATWLRGVPHTPDGLALYRPDLGTVRANCWVDTIYHEPVFLALLADVSGDVSWREDALAVWFSHTRALSSDLGPFLGHSWESSNELLRGYAWGRGNAWALLGMVDTLEILPAGAPGRDAAVAEMRALATAVAEAQDPSGFWRTLLHDREAYLESSTAAMFGAAFTKARRLSLLPPEFDEPAERAWMATRSRIDVDGRFFGVSAWTHAAITRDDDPDHYRRLPTETNWWGQGAAMRAAAERLRAGFR